MLYRLFIFSLSLFLFACQEETTDTTQEDLFIQPLELNYTTAPVTFESVDDSNFQFAADVVYDNAHERNVLDIFTINSETPAPLVLFIHPGGFIQGDKKEAYNFTAELESILKENIAFATINYRFLQHTDDGVRTSLHDARRALQFLRLHAEELNIDPERVGVLGVSAGGGAAMWLGTQDDMANLKSMDLREQQSTRPQAVVALGVQASYDLVQWEAIFKEFDFNLDADEERLAALYSFYGISSLDELYSKEMEAYRAEVDMLDLMTVDDVPFYAINIGPTAKPQDDGELYHHPFHVAALKEAADAAGVANQVYAPTMGIWAKEGEEPIEYMIRRLKEE
ncbi:MAG: alpha/beta hydrolase [Bacteroidota bacterium]